MGKKSKDMIMRAIADSSASSTSILELEIHRLLRYSDITWRHLWLSP